MERNKPLFYDKSGDSRRLKKFERCCSSNEKIDLNLVSKICSAGSTPAMETPCRNTNHEFSLGKRVKYS